MNRFWMLGIAVGLLLGVQAADISGTWVAKRQTPAGEVEVVYELTMADGRITGLQRLPTSDARIVDGKVTGDRVELTVEFDMGGRITQRVITGQIVGDELHLDSPALPGPPPGAPGASAMPGAAPGAAPGAGATAGAPRPSTPAPGATSAAGAPGAGTAPPAGAAGGANPRNALAGPLVARRGTPTPIYRAGLVDYKALPHVELPALKTVPSNGLAKTPPMGWNSWNKFRTKIDDQTVREIADAMVSSGMKAAGYTYINIDDGWEWKRDAQGAIQTNPNFPDMKALADYVHGKGLKLGIYSSPGPRTCAGYEGSYGHEENDAKTWAAWGIDYLKYDWCSAGRVWKDEDMPAVYQRMAEALARTGRPIVFSLCQYGRFKVQEWGPTVSGNLWRTTGDIRDQWASMAKIGFSQSDLAPYAAPGHWNDPDMLEIGNGGMTDTEYRTHFSLWAMLAAPLIAGNDLRAMTPETKAILTNGEVIAIDQDPLGRQGARLSMTGDTEVWTRPLAGGAQAVALFNRGERAADVSVTWADLKLTGAPRVRDLWDHADKGRVKDGYTASVPAHGVVLLRVSQ